MAGAAAAAAAAIAAAAAASAASSASAIAAAAAAAFHTAPAAYCRVILLSNGLKKAQKHTDQDVKKYKERAGKMLVGLLPCQSGGGAHCVLWRGEDLCAGVLCTCSLWLWLSLFWWQ
jgi:hypothetical protein